MYGPEHNAIVESVQEETMAQVRAGQMVPERIEPWWEGRRENEQTPDFLGRVLDEAGLRELAGRARLGHFDDFHAPTDVADGVELLHLVAELRLAVRAGDADAEKVAVIENAVRRGEFDATAAESDRWAAGADGQRTMRALAKSAATGRNDPCPCGSGLKYKRCHGG